MSQGTKSSNGRTLDRVVDFEQVRAKRMDEKRRKTERIFFKNLLSVYCVIGDSHIRPIELLEVSEEGCSFQIPFDGRHLWPKQADLPLPIRFYFSHDTYLLVHFLIQNSRQSIGEGNRYIRYGCVVDRNMSSYPAYQGFVKFLKLYSEHAHKDEGNVSVFYI